MAKKPQDSNYEVIKAILEEPNKYGLQNNARRSTIPEARPLKPENTFDSNNQVILDILARPNRVGGLSDVEEQRVGQGIQQPKSR